MAFRKRPASAFGDAIAHDIDAFPPYCLLKRSCLPKLREAAPDFKGIEFSIVRRKRARDAQNQFTAPLSLDPQSRSKDSDEEAAHATSKWDLHVWLNKNHCQYHRLVGLSTNLVCWGKSGKRLASPYPVSSDEWGNFDVHHLDWDSTNVAQANLRQC